MKNLKGSAILLLAAFIWGTTFVAQTSATDSVGPFCFSASRSIVGALFLLVFILLRDSFKRKSQQTEKQYSLKEHLKGGTVCGAVLFAAMNAQQMGISLYPSEAAASGRAGFITATYVVMVAVFSFLKDKKFNPTVLLATVITVAGMYLLCLSGGINKLYLGDLFELLCAVLFTTHILVIDKFNYLDGVKISCIQFFTCFLISLVCTILFEKNDFSSVLNAAVPILYAGVLSSGIAYTLQIIGQKYAKPAVASIVMSLESVFAVLAGFVVLNEKLLPRELVGCILVFSAVILAQIPQFKKGI